MDPTAGFDPLVSGFTFSGSLISFVATTVVLVCFVCYRHEQQSFRHALVFNLALAEFINTLNNTISGSIYLHQHALYPGTACTINGFVGQLSVQASDFSILVIAIVTLLTITRTTSFPSASTAKKATICVSVWIVPLLTSGVATALGAMGPVSGNWCWIMSTRTDLRYALTHGWRIAIIFCTAGIYLFVWWFMHRHFRGPAAGTTTDTGAGPGISSVRDLRWVRRRKGFKKMGAGVEGADDGGGGADGRDRDDVVVDTELSTMTASRISRAGGGGCGGWGLSAPEAAFVGGDKADGFGHGGVDVETGGRKTRRQRRRSFSDSEDSHCYDHSFDDGDDDDDDEDDDDEDNDDDDDVDEEEHQHTSKHVRIAATVPSDPHAQRRSMRSIAPSRHHHAHPQQQQQPPSKFDGLNTTDTTASEFPRRRQARVMEREIKRVLLLNAYPIMYVVLWIPGLANRFMEAAGHRSESRVLAALQASSQFVGLANALTYGFNTALRRKARRWWRARKPAARKPAEGGRAEGGRAAGEKGQVRAKGRR